MLYYRCLWCLAILATVFIILPAATHGDGQRNCLLRVILWDASIVRDAGIGDQWEVNLFVNDAKIPLISPTSREWRRVFPAYPVEVYREALSEGVHQLRIRAEAIEHEETALDDRGADERFLRIKTQLIVA